MPEETSILAAAGGNADGAPDNKGGSADAKPDAGKPGDGKPADAKPDAGKPDAGAAGDGGKKPDADGAPKLGADGKPIVKPDAGKPEGAPETYETFKVPEGVVLDTTTVEKFNAVAKELNLTQAQAQRLVDFQTEAIKGGYDNSQKEFDKLQETWKQETRKALGADADKELAFAAKARDTFVSKELLKLFEADGLTNNPEVVKFFITLGKAISEDGFPEGRIDKGGKKTHAEMLYPEESKK